MNTLNEEQSLRLGMLRFPLIVGVVFIHARLMAADFINAKDGFDYYVSDFVQHLISEGVAHTAVPLLFLMSGYLFFNGFESSLECYWKKIKSRTRSLLVPFLFWNVATLLFFWFAQTWSVTSGYFSGQRVAVAEYGGMDYLDAILGIDRRPISYQFWFIRDLMLLVLLTPIIHQLNKRIPLPFLLCLFSIWFFVWVDFEMPAPPGLLFYSLGCYLGYTRTSLFGLDRHGPAIVTTYVMLLLAGVIWAQSPLYPYVHKVDIMLGMISCLYLTKLMAGFRISRQVLASLGAASFFVYAAHEPLLSVLNRLAYRVVRPEGSGSMLVMYFLIPTMLIIVLVGVYRLSRQVLPQFTSMITGGR